MIDESTNSSAPVLVQSPFCGSLRSKKFFMLDRIATTADEYLDATNHVWCCQTQEVIGPDNKLVVPDKCTPGRSCYKSAIE